MITDRLTVLKDALLTEKPSVCAERAVIWTSYHKNKQNKNKLPIIKNAEAMYALLDQKQLNIYDKELIVGNFSSKRIGGSIYPELHGLPVLEDVLKFSKRKTNPLQISSKEKRQLLSIVPFWLTKFLAIKAFHSMVDTAKFVIHQLKGKEYILNETGGIGHFAPDYEKLVNSGVEGIIEEAISNQKKHEKDSEKWQFYDAVIIANKALINFAERYSTHAQNLATKENDSQRKQELLKISEVCENVPKKPAKTFHEALQSIFFVQIAINLESLDNGISPGRMDQYLYPFYKKDIEEGILTKEEAFELLGAFSIKFSELIPVLSEQISKFHGGLMSGQVISIGGIDSQGKDATNELSFLFLDVIEALNLRQPNYHARISSQSPKEYLDRIYGILAKGNSSPALYNDDIIIESLVKQGYNLSDANNYTPVGCVEPTSQGKSFASTDAALFNLANVLEQTLNKIAKTKPVSFNEITAEFEIQLKFKIKQLIADLHAMEIANKEYHPTPLSSSFIDGCISSGICSTAGGAIYNFSGVQLVGAVDVADSLFAIKEVVFDSKKMTFKELMVALQNNLSNNETRKHLKSLPKFGNDQEEVDLFTKNITELFTDELNKYTNKRGGKYITGIYSMTTHVHFGNVTGALPNGRRKGEALASGIAPTNGADKQGPTAMFNSLNRLDFSKFTNGVNLNVKLNKNNLKGKVGVLALDSLITTYFNRKGMQVQVNVLSPKTLIEAQEDPESHPNLLVRVSGYSAYFNDLTKDVQDEIIQRSLMIDGGMAN